MGKGNEIEAHRLRQEVKDITSLKVKAPRKETRAKRRAAERKKNKTTRK